jgi:hypothetical protein
MDAPLLRVTERSRARVMRDIFYGVVVDEEPLSRVDRNGQMIRIEPTKITIVYDWLPGEEWIATNTVIRGDDLRENGSRIGGHCQSKVYFPWHRVHEAPAWVRRAIEIFRPPPLQVRAGEDVDEFDDGDDPPRFIDVHSDLL